MQSQIAALGLLLLPLVVAGVLCVQRMRRTRATRLGFVAALLVALGISSATGAVPHSTDLSQWIQGGEVTGYALQWIVNLLALVTTLVLGRTIHERNRAEEVQLGSMEAVRALTDFFAKERAPFEERLRELLALGCRELALEIGVYARIEGGRWQPVESRVPGTEAPPWTAGLPLEETFCSDAAAAGGVLAIEAVEDTRGAGGRARASTGFACYVGIPIHVDGVLRGSLLFASERARTVRFSGVEKQLLALMGHWVEAELGQQAGAGEKQLVPRRSEDGERRRVEVNEALLQLEEELRTSLGRGLRLETDPETGFARGYRFEFERVLRALVQHAAETCSDGADLVVSTGRVPASEAAAGSGGFVTLSVAAPGPGLDAAGQARLFERAAGMGDEPPAGVDAAIPLERVRRVLQDQGGDLSIHSENGVGTTLTAWLPAEPAETPEAGKPDGSAGS